MCGIVGAVAQRQVGGILLEGLRRLEYRGYDSAGIALLDPGLGLKCTKRAGKVAALSASLEAEPLLGVTGIAHTRWATHGRPSEVNAHPQLSADRLALVHNGIIENHERLRERLRKAGYRFVSETDTEVIVHLIDSLRASGLSLLDAVKASISELEGAFAIAVIASDEPHRLVAARKGSPLVVGIGIGEHFVASDQMALRQVTDRVIFLEEGDIVDVTTLGVRISDAAGRDVQRPIEQLGDMADHADRGHFRHFMLKEIHEQPSAIANTLRGRIGAERIYEQAFGVAANEVFADVAAVQIVACGTSYHSGLVARYWVEEHVGIPCAVEIASEFRYRKLVVAANTLFVTISQSGETADTLAALRLAHTLGYRSTLAICNAPQSSLVRESHLAIMTEAGPEIGVASTKAFTTQLVALMLLTGVLAKRRGADAAHERRLVEALHGLPALVEQVLALDERIREVAGQFVEKRHALFLGRGVQYPVAMEGALKLKEISYIHAEAYAAGELKHGPLALVDDDMPVVAVAPNNELLEKLRSNLSEVQARGGRLYVFADEQAGFSDSDTVTVVQLPHVPSMLEPVVYTVPLQLLAYHVAVMKGTDVDQPRNLAKSVTVE
ncbi:MAG: glutamine--fructose-6-phosphate transaminase (isomerizing) [Gammaproteobacteria bacterium]|jgi:glucosamine--fructose-6-phosphate aminotransferase (isomerizing)|nr:glutamine--fructose-6-phosphate transaminase (isomerizing) [Gammaproteobacteria bacterium]MBP6053876.1 glutamine--fructose-6-phosphate transaminase (isomerizing) [Pseudomonadales bacterium]MBK7519030.1 glutamine--fructose-6-phosphate transaminase (isomerizing) [Gammaproteobacteria bacterium]MBK7730228.1 glutamine--fructose-6-phosphate transaminase (isomerizing) [Gammaproteobacteria bacterium]MBK8306044.1 glutamine--fructose-6-phosphate transaminase (isomerizing) [Gammaproteobacteria bacteriu